LSERPFSGHQTRGPQGRAALAGDRGPSPGPKSRWARERPSGAPSCPPGHMRRTSTCGDRRAGDPFVT
jgi:hypothetical protein